MGCAFSQNDWGSDAEGFKRDASVNRRIRIDETRLARTVKVLLLGTYSFLRIRYFNLIWLDQQGLVNRESRPL